MNAARYSADNIVRFGEYVKHYYEGREFTNTAQQSFSRRLATVLGQHGVGRGDLVLIQMQNCPEVTASFPAIWRLGAVVIPVMPQFSAREVHYILEDSGAKVVLTTPLLAHRLRDASAEVPGFRHLLVFGETDVASAINVLPPIAAAAEHPEIVEMEDSDLAVLLYTSGTTGHPKGVMLTHGNVVASVEAVTRLNLDTPREVALHVLPMSHVYGMLLMNLVDRWGFTSVLVSKFDPVHILELIEIHKVRQMPVVPTMLIYLLNCPRRKEFDTSTLRKVTSGGAPLAEQVRLDFEREFACRVEQGYGLSESCSVAASYGEGEPYRPGASGRAIPDCEIRIMDGEICMRGPHVMKGYWNLPQETAAQLAGGWLHTGDIGWIDGDGYVYVVDRKKDLIIKGGENISPREIEEILHEHPAVAEAAVIGVPHPIYGEDVYAVIVPRAGLAVTEEELQAHTAQSVNRFKVPSRIVFRQVLPKNSSNKTLKRELRSEVVAELAAPCDAPA